MMMAMKVVPQLLAFGISHSVVAWLYCIYRLLLSCWYSLEFG